MKAPRVEGASVHDEPRQVGHDTTQGLGVLIAELPPRRHSQPVRTSLNRRPAVAPSRRQGQLGPVGQQTAAAEAVDPSAHCSSVQPREFCAHGRREATAGRNEGDVRLDAA
jgi:hypothetical protein